MNPEYRRPSWAESVSYAGLMLLMAVGSLALAVAAA